jgi:diaminohydroxyphosphoribosylaminopyrimidine deaminase/5-amino-6-(5-phosphoribosylamino)uracil reductase
MNSAAAATNTLASDTAFMQRALALAKRAWGATHPNPHVGAVIVEGERIVAEGWHKRAGEAHAEIAALQALGRPPAPDATLVVTLEPCSTHGHTGACTDAILAAGIKHVVVGATDPSPAHAGRAFALLREHGVEVREGVLADACADLNLIFNHRVTHGGKPLVALKTAATLDGKIATRTGASQWITGEAARADVAHWRRYFPAIATSAATVFADNPRLTARIDGEPEWCPRRFVFDRRLLLAKKILAAKTAKRPTGFHLFDDPYARETTIVTTNAIGNVGIAAALREHGLTVWELGGGKMTKNKANDIGKALFFRDVINRCVVENIGGIYVEGGGTFLGAWLDAKVSDYLFFYTAPKILGDAAALPAFRGNPRETLAALTTLQDVHRELIGEDLLTRGFLA